MESKHLILPEQKNYESAYELALKLAGEQLARMDNIEQQCRQSGAQYQVKGSKKVITIQYLNQSYQITLPDIEVSLIGSEEKVALRDKILILHYLILAKGTPAANKMVTYQDLPEGAIYFPTFSKRTIKPLLDHFGQEPHRLVAPAEKLGGHQADYGDVAVTINAFCHMPITIIMWQGDREFAPSGSILFDANITDYLSTEDISVLCETITWKLVRLLKNA